MASLVNSSSSSSNNGTASNSNNNGIDNDMLLIISATLEDFYEQNRDQPETIVATGGIITTVLKNALKSTTARPTTTAKNCDPTTAKAAEVHRRIRLSNPKIQNRIVNVAGALDILGLAGFETASSIATTTPTTTTTTSDDQNQKNSNNNNNNDFLVYMPHNENNNNNNNNNNKPNNALELYLMDDDDDDKDRNQNNNKQTQQQEQLVNAIIRGLDVKIQELQVTFGITNDKNKNKTKVASTSTNKTSLSASSTSTTNRNNSDNNDSSSSSSSPFLSEEERLKRMAKIKAMKRAKKDAKMAALHHWEENKQERKEMEARREALLQARIRAEATKAQEGGGGQGPQEEIVSPLGVTIKMNANATSSTRRTPLPLAKPMAPAVDLDRQKQALAAAARARMERASTGKPTSSSSAAAASARANPTPPATPAVVGDKDHTMDVDAGDGSEVVPDGDKKPSAKKRPAQNSNVANNNSSVEAESSSISSTTSPLIREWEEFLEHVPRCAPAEGIRDTSYYRGRHGDDESTATHVAPRCLKRLFKELDNLKDMLPSNHSSSIWLRFDEEAPQYIRALIAAVLPGPTPYSGGLFCFDMYVPADYPQVSPQVHLVSRGGVNFAFGPNLYPDGHVCLSLLGTSPGPGWIPGHSSLHQVLVSMQGLLLGIEHPYYLMRGGWDGLIKEGDFTSKGQTLTGKTVSEQVNIDKHAVLYEDNIRIGTVKYTMLEPLSCCLDSNNDNNRNKKSKGTTGRTDIIWQQFKPVIRAHFSTNRIAILNEIQNWRSDQVMGRDRSVAANERIAIDEINDLLPKLQNYLSKISMPDKDNIVEMKSPAASVKLKDESDNDRNYAATGKPATKKTEPLKQATLNNDGKTTAMDIEHPGDIDTKQSAIAETDIVEKKRLRMQEAAAKGDFVRAGRLQEEINRLEQLEKSIQEAARQNDFIRAGRLQAQLKALTATESSRAGPPRPDNRNNDIAMSDDEDMSDDDDDEEQGNLAEAMANMPGMGGMGMPGQRAGRRALPHGRNVFPPPTMRARIPASNHNWGTGSQLNAPPAPAVAPTAKAPPPAKKAISSDQLCRLRIRLPSNKSVLEDFEKTQALSAVYHRLTALMQEAAEASESQQASAPVAPIVNGAGAFSQPLSSAGFTLLLTRPKREFSLEMHGTKSLDELNLAPSATLTVMRCSDRGVLHRGELESRLRQAQGDALDVEGLTYEGLVELTERLGAAAPAEGSTFVNLSHEDLAKNSETFSPATYLDKLENSMEEEHGEDALRCPICLGEYDHSDQSASLRKLSNCMHIFHSACLDTWFRTKSSCPLCKSSIVPES